MADQKISELGELAAVDIATDDLFAIVDTSSTSTKKLTVASLLTSTAFTGTPTAPTAASTTNTTQIATTAFVQQSLKGLNSVQTFTASGTWTRPTGVTKVLAFVTGGGGGGGNASTEPADGGGTAIKFLDVSAISSATITVGAGGATSTSPTAGGSSSWADGTNTITGGGASNINPGTATGGDLNISGGVRVGSSDGGGSFWGPSSKNSTYPIYGAGGAGLQPGNDGIIWVLEFK